MGNFDRFKKLGNFGNFWKLKKLGNFESFIKCVVEFTIGINLKRPDIQAFAFWAHN